MEVYQGLENFKKLPNAIVTSGTFDGVHLGHQKILQILQQTAQEREGESVIITFFPHPRMVLYNDSQQLKLINTLDEKINLLEQYGVNHLIIIPFTREFSELSSHQFIQQILVDSIGAKTLIMGYDHRFGRNREGSFEYLQSNSAIFGFDIVEIPRVDIENNTTSSTAIRTALQKGEVSLAQKLLGRPYSISGKVVKGRQLGRTIGFPTANIYVQEHYKLIPADGVYAVYVLHNHKRYGGVINIGFRPTVEGKERSLEVHIFDFDRDIYGETLQIELIEHLRPEMKFDNLEALKAQISADAEKAKAVIKL